MAHKNLALTLRKTISLLDYARGATLLLQDESAYISNQVPWML
jgi:hypothetical protein